MRLSTIIISLALLLVSVGAMAQRPTDNLDRGLVAVYNGSGVFCSWRVLADEYYGVKYNIYRGGTKLNDSPLSVSNYTDASGSSSDTYTVKTVVNDVEQDDACTAVSVWSTADGNSNYYLNIQMQDVVDRNGNVVFCCCGSHTPASTVAQNYILNDCSMADLDGDGQMEIIVKRINQSDADATDDYAFNSEIYSTTNTRAFVLLEAYKLDGTRLWWIDCGPNMVSMNSTEINAIAYDWDQDGKAEVVLRGADNMIIHEANGTSYTVGNSNVNTRNKISNHTNSQYAWTHTGSEYLIYMNGTTGVPYQVMTYPLKRLESGESSESKAWGDGYGHRSSKYFFGAPFLDGRKASLFLARGIYTRHKMIAYDIDPSTHKLTEKWSWSNNTSGSDWYGQGYHNYSIADVDGDGCDEIVYGSMVIDNNGKGLSTTGLGHGDAQHVGDFDPYRKGLEVFACNESNPANNYRNATTSDIYYRLEGSSDDGRAMMANFTNSYPGSVGRSVGSGMISSVTDGEISALGGDSFISWSKLNWPIYWDGDLCSEYFDSPGEEREAVVYKPGGSRLMQSSGCKLNNDSKNNPCFIGDVLGDWREEILVRASDNTALRLLTTTTPTTYRVPCLWNDPEYRQAMVWQMCGYNQPPHVSYFMGEMEGLTKVPVPLTMKNRTEISEGGNIPSISSTNSGDVLAYGLSNIGIPTAGASPRSLIIDVPSTVSGNNGSSITTSYSTTQLGTDSNKGDLTGTMNLVKQGDGLLKIVNNTFSYTGNTDVYAGSVFFAGTLSASPVWMNRHTTLYTAGTYNSSVTMEYGSTLNISSTGANTGEYATTTINTLNLREGARVVFDIDKANSKSDVLNLTTLSIRKQNWTNGPTYSAPVLQINSTAPLAAGRYLIGTLTTVTGSLDNIVVEGTFADDTKHKLKLSSGNLYLVVSNGDETYIGETDKSTTWWSEFSDSYTIKTGYKYNFKFKNYGGTENWYNWLLVLANGSGHSTSDRSDYAEYFVLRADNYGWGTSYNAPTLKVNDKAITDSDWATFKTDMAAGADVDMDVAFNNSVITMNATITATSGNIYTYSITSQEVTADDVTAFFSVDHSYITDPTATEQEIMDVIETVGTRDASTGACTGTYDETKSTNTYALTEGKTYYFSFVNYNSIKANSSAGNWQNWVLGCTDGTNALFKLRADNWEDVAGNNTNCVSDFDFSGTNFMTDMDGARVNMNVTYMNSTVNVVSTITTTAGKFYTYSYTKSGVTASSLNLYFTVNASQVVLYKAINSEIKQSIYAESFTGTSTTPSDYGYTVTGSTATVTDGALQSVVNNATTTAYHDFTSVGTGNVVIFTCDWTPGNATGKGYSNIVLSDGKNNILTIQKGNSSNTNYQYFVNGTNVFTTSSSDGSTTYAVSATIDMTNQKITALKIGSKYTLSEAIDFQSTSATTLSRITLGHKSASSWNNTTKIDNINISYAVPTVSAKIQFATVDGTSLSDMKIPVNVSGTAGTAINDVVSSYKESFYSDDGTTRYDYTSFSNSKYGTILSPKGNTITMNFTPATVQRCRLTATNSEFQSDQVIAEDYLTSTVTSLDLYYNYAIPYNGTWYVAPAKYINSVSSKVTYTSSSTSFTDSRAYTKNSDILYFFECEDMGSSNLRSTTPSSSTQNRCSGGKVNYEYAKGYCYTNDTIPAGTYNITLRARKTGNSNGDAILFSKKGTAYTQLSTDTMDISGASCSDYTWKNVKLTEDCCIAIKQGDWANSEFDYIMIESTAPKITTQPADIAETGVGVEYSFSIVATSPSGLDLTYQWYSNTVKSNEGGTAIDGATEASYTTSKSATGTYYYYCVVTNDGGSIASNAVQVTVNATTAVITFSETNGLTANMKVYDSTGAAVAANADGTFSVKKEADYTYTATLLGYYAASGVLNTSDDSKTVEYTMTALTKPAYATPSDALNTSTVSADMTAGANSEISGYDAFSLGNKMVTTNDFYLTPGGTMQIQFKTAQSSTYDKTGASTDFNFASTGITYNIDSKGAKTVTGTITEGKWYRVVISSNLVNSMAKCGTGETNDNTLDITVFDLSDDSTVASETGISIRNASYGLRFMGVSTENDAAVCNSYTYFTKDYVFNGSFDADMAGWTNTNTKPDSRADLQVFQYVSGDKNIYMWGDWSSDQMVANTVYQTIPNLPAGYYNFSADCVASGNQATFAVKSGGVDGTDLYTESFWANPAETKSGVVQLTEAGSLTIAYSIPAGNGSWYTLDNVSLKYLGDAAATMSCTAGKLSTFCAPFEVTLPDGVKAYSAVSPYTTELDLTRIAVGGDNLAAGTPVILYSQDGLTLTTLYGIKTVTDDTKTEGALTGMLTETGRTIATGKYVLMTKEGEQNFYYVAKSGKGALNRCYVTAGTEVKPGEAKMSIVFDDMDTPTEISFIDAEDDARTVSGVRKYMKNGRVVIETTNGTFTTTGSRMK